MRDLKQSHEYVTDLTFRQHEFFWERYLHQQQWDIQLQINLNPWISKKKKAPPPDFDLSSEDGMTALAEAGIASVKSRRIKKKES